MNATPFPATLEDLVKADGKAELVGGRIVHIPPNGFFSGRVARRILLSLDQLPIVPGGGEAFGGNVGYILNLPLTSGRQSFSPDVSYHTGPLPTNWMKFIDGAPAFAVEIRSENDYGPKPDREYADKRKDYFEAGTLVVWDVDPVNKTVSVYTSADPITATVFRRGDTADAEPAVPGWRLSVDALFA